MPTPSLQTGKDRYRVLVIDDDEVDRMRVERMLRTASRHGWTAEIVTAETKAAGKAALQAESFDCVLLDIRLSDGNGMELLREVGAVSGETPPVVILTTLDDKSATLQGLALGAQDYLIKGDFSDEMLLRSIRYAIERDRVVKERNRLTRELKEAMTSIRTLKALLPICCGCRKIRDDKGYWSDIESYVCEHTDSTFSHGFCPDCLARWEADAERWLTAKGGPGRPA